MFTTKSQFFLCEGSARVPGIRLVKRGHGHTCRVCPLIAVASNCIFEFFRMLFCNYIVGTQAHRRRCVLCSAQVQRSVVILPGLGNNSNDYTSLAGQLRAKNAHVEIAAVKRLDWQVICSSRQCCWLFFRCSEMPGISQPVLQKLRLTPRRELKQMCCMPPATAQTRTRPGASQHQIGWGRSRVGWHRVVSTCASPPAHPITSHRNQGLADPANAASSCCAVLCRARNAAGLTDVNYWKGTLKPRPTVDWYLTRVGEAVEAAKRATDGAPITLLTHSVGAQ